MLKFIVKIIEEIKQRKKIEKDLEVIMKEWEYEPNKKMPHHNMTMKEFIEDRMKYAMCECEKKYEHWVKLINAGTYETINPCCNENKRRRQEIIEEMLASIEV